MIQRLYIIISSLLISSICYADFNGMWSGELRFNGAACEATIEIHRSENSLSIVAKPDSHGYNVINCDDNNGFGLAEEYLINNSELWRYDAPMGEISGHDLLAKNRVCDNETCTYWDFIKIRQSKGNNIFISINYDGDILSGELTRDP